MNPPPVEKDSVMTALREVIDPELGVNIVDLGLVYSVDVAADGRVKVRMTLSSPACPLANAILSWAHRALAAVPGVTDAAIELVWEPRWTPDMAAEHLRGTIFRQ
jgi:metal-sulfur cluster biosynthetic enzyme